MARRAGGRRVDVRGLSGGAALQRKLDELPKRLRLSIVDKVAKPIANQVRQVMRSYIGKKTGLLKRSIKISKFKTRAGYRVHVDASKFPPAPNFYPAFVEYGHGKVPAKSYIRKTAITMRSTIAAQFKRGITAGLEKEWTK